MPQLPTFEHTYALMGAWMRYQQLQTEMAALTQAFPELLSGSFPAQLPATPAPAGKRRGRPRKQASIEANLQALWTERQNGKTPAQLAALQQGRTVLATKRAALKSAAGLPMRREGNHLVVDPARLTPTQRAAWEARKTRDRERYHARQQKPSKKKMSAAARKRMSEAAKARWAKARKSTTSATQE